MPTNLLTTVAKHVASYDGPLTRLAAEAEVPYSWLVMFARGEIENPGILQIERLAAHFARPTNGRQNKKVAAS